VQRAIAPPALMSSQTRKPFIVATVAVPFLRPDTNQKTKLSVLYRAHMVAPILL